MFNEKNGPRKRSTFNQWTFSIPPLDRNTYARIREMSQVYMIGQHGLVTIGLNLLYRILRESDKLPPELLPLLMEQIRSIQDETGVRKILPPT